MDDPIMALPPRKAIIVDLDGTLCDHSARQPYAVQKDWDGYNARIPNDKVNEPVLTIVRAMAMQNHKIYLCTGRFREYAPVTLQWLERFEVPFDELLMRETGDYRSDHEVKKDMLQLIPQEIMFVIDDRKSVTDMWRSQGLFVFQCAEGNY